MRLLKQKRGEKTTVRIRERLLYMHTVYLYRLDNFWLYCLSCSKTSLKDINAKRCTLVTLQVSLRTTDEGRRGKHVLDLGNGYVSLCAHLPQLYLHVGFRMIRVDIVLTTDRSTNMPAFIRSSKQSMQASMELFLNQ